MNNETNENTQTPTKKKSFRKLVLVTMLVFLIFYICILVAAFMSGEKVAIFGAIMFGVLGGYLGFVTLRQLNTPKK